MRENGELITPYNILSLITSGCKENGYDDVDWVSKAAHWTVLTWDYPSKFVILGQSCGLRRKYEVSMQDKHQPEKNNRSQTTLYRNIFKNKRIVDLPTNLFKTHRSLEYNKFCFRIFLKLNFRISRFFYKTSGRWNQIGDRKNNCQNLKNST